MATMVATVGIYTKRNRPYGYGYDNPNLISEKKYEELVAQRYEELKNNEQEFADYLADTYSHKELFDMADNYKDVVRQSYEDKCEDWARDDLEEDWEYQEVETEIDIPDICTCSKRK